MKMEKYVNNPRQMADVTQIRAGNLVKEKSTFYNLEKDGTFRQLNNHSPRRRLEFNNANHFYLSDAAKYLCTHHKEKLNLGSINYVEITVHWEVFVELCIGQFHDQYPKFMEELQCNAQRYCYIPKEDGGYYIMPPFRLDFTTETDEELSERQLRKLKNIHAHKIKTITFSMAKPLFLQYIEGGQYYKHPAHLYANIYHKISDIEAIIKGYPQFKDMYNEEYGCTEFIAAYVRFIDYLYIHGAGTNSQISIDLLDMLSKVLPSLCRGNKERKLHYVSKLENFLIVAATLTCKLDGLDYILKPIKAEDFTADKHLILRFDRPKMYKKW